MTNEELARQDEANPLAREVRLDLIDCVEALLTMVDKKQFPVTVKVIERSLQRAKEAL